MSWIKFYASKVHLEAFPKPEKAAKFTPDWYKKLERQTGDHPNSGTAKRCIPMLETFHRGYIIPLWCDLFVRCQGEDMQLDFPSTLPMRESLGQHGQVQIENHPLSDMPYGKLPLKFINPWIIETADNWSCLFTSPLNHMEKRFKILDGVVDTDSYYNNINLPFIWTGGDGEFFIPKGTPLVQVIPFERVETTMDHGEIDLDRNELVQAKLGTHLRDSYRQEFWGKRKGNVVDIVSKG